MSFDELIGFGAVQEAADELTRRAIRCGCLSHPDRSCGPQLQTLTTACLIVAGRHLSQWGLINSFFFP